MVIPDYRNVERETLKNTYYRKILYTIPGVIQYVLMSLRKGENIPTEMHRKTAQFIRIESGHGVAKIWKNKNMSDMKTYRLANGISIIIPPGFQHVIKNNGSKDLKLYTIYTPPEHEHPNLSKPFIKNKRQP